MDNNDILRRLRYVFDLADTKIAQMCTSAGAVVELKTVTNWLKKDEDDLSNSCSQIRRSGSTFRRFPSQAV